MPNPKGSVEELKLTKLVPAIRAQVVEILKRSSADLAGHQAFKSDQRKLARWAADCAEHILPLFESKYPPDFRPRRAIETCRVWVATGEFKMALIRKASLDSHAAARQAERNSAAYYAARSAGHAVATAHVPTHALGASAYAIKAAATYTGNPDDGLVVERSWQIMRLREYANR
ncbi:MAG: putative immunity protein [Methanocella sp.]